MATLTGCAATPAWDPADFFIAVRYDVGETADACKTGTAWERRIEVQYDFGRLADLGFDTVLVKPAPAAEVKVALDAAAKQHMNVALTLEVYDGPDAQARTRSSANGYHYAPVPSSLATHPSLRATIVEAGCTNPGACRAVDICASVTKAGLRCVPLFESAHLADSGKRTPCKKAREIAASAPAVVDAAHLADKRRPSPKQRLFAQFHAALSAAQTGGLVVTGWQHEDANGNARFDSLAAPRAAITALIRRARQWGPRLVGATAIKANATVSCAPCFRVTAFTRGERRHILVFNPALDRKARGDLRIGAGFAGKTVKKAVQVPDDTSAALGTVHNAVRGEVVVSLVLAPGEAVLFEVF